MIHWQHARRSTMPLTFTLRLPLPALSFWLQKETRKWGLRCRGLRPDVRMCCRVGAAPPLLLMECVGLSLRVSLRILRDPPALSPVPQACLVHVTALEFRLPVCMAGCTSYGWWTPSPTRSSTALPRCVLRVHDWHLCSKLRLLHCPGTAHACLARYEQSICGIHMSRKMSNPYVELEWACTSPVWGTCFPDHAARS